MLKVSVMILVMILALAAPFSVVPVARAEEAGSPFRVFVYDVPEGIDQACEQAGTVTEETYTTYVYSENGTPGRAMKATLYVYTPYGYDPSREYNVLYLMHGRKESEGYWFSMKEYAPGGESHWKALQMFTVNMLDNMIAAGTCDDVIVVTPTYYNNYSATGDMKRFAYEMKNDIIPMVEAKYATYARGDVSPENLIATRDHRAYAGLSVGSQLGFEAIWDGCLDYISWIGNFSGFVCPSESADIEAVAQKLVDKKNSDFAAYDINYWYNGTGTYDSARPDQTKGYGIILEKGADFLQEGEDLAAGDNCILVDKPGKKHSYDSWIVDLYNVLSVFFTQ